MKLIASDLDGTLLNDKGEISAENAAAIKKAKEKGIDFVVATGRSYDAAKIPLEAAGISCPIITLNGSITFSEGKKVLRKVAMDPSVAKEILSVCNEADMYLEFFTNNGIYSVSREYFLEVMVDIMKSADSNLSEEAIREKAELRFQAEPVQFINNYHEIFSVEGIEIYKILGFSLQPEKLTAVHEQLKGEETLAITSSGDINIEFNHVDAQKGMALDYLAKSMGIDMEDVMALGDNLNDSTFAPRKI